MKDSIGLSVVALFSFSAIMQKTKIADHGFSGQFKCSGDNKLLIFELGEPMVTKIVEQIIVP